jgi:hypothetical protein
VIKKLDVCRIVVEEIFLTLKLFHINSHQKKKNREYTEKNVSILSSLHLSLRGNRMKKELNNNKVKKEHSHERKIDIKLNA